MSGFLKKINIYSIGDGFSLELTLKLIKGTDFMCF